MEAWVQAFLDEINRMLGLITHPRLDDTSSLRRSLLFKKGFAGFHWTMHHQRDVFPAQVTSHG